MRQATLSFLLTLARSKLVASIATHDASPENSRICTIGRVQPFVLGDGAGKTQQHSRRDTREERVKEEERPRKKSTGRLRRT